MDLKKFCEEYDLGILKGKPQSVSGGLMHRMFRVQTEQGVFCIKALNPLVMARPEALENTIRSEKIARMLPEEIPAVTARLLKGEAVTKLDGQYYMVFEWLEGTSVFAPQIEPEHCQKIGDILGRIHQLQLELPEMQKERGAATLYDWEQYRKEAPWAGLYEENLEQLQKWNRKAAEAGNWLAQNLVLSHRDLDPKNVMWQGRTPFLIDWEAAGYVNPYQEFWEVLNYWADDGQGDLLSEQFCALAEAYRRHMDVAGVNWDAVAAGGYEGMLGWLDYNLKRALGWEASDKAEQELGAKQVVQTIHELKQYDRKVEQMKQWLEK